MISIPEKAWSTAQAIQDTELRLKYLEAVIKYRLNGEMPSDEVNPYLVSILDELDANRSRSLKMKGNSNAKKKKKKSESKPKQTKTLHTTTSSKSYGDPGINDLIAQIKEVGTSLGVVYDKKREREFAHHILTAKEFGEFTEKVKQTRTEFALNILKASVVINYWKGACAGPMMIYQNYAEVYNLTVQRHNKEQKNRIQSF